MKIELKQKPWGCLAKMDMICVQNGSATVWKYKTWNVIVLIILCSWSILMCSSSVDLVSQRLELVEIPTRTVHSITCARINFVLLTYLQTGECRCKPGYVGHECNDQCGEGFYGSGCRSKCSCTDGKTCDFITGACINVCPPGWVGDYCDKRTSSYFLLVKLEKKFSVCLKRYLSFISTGFFFFHFLFCTFMHYFPRRVQ